MRGTTDQAVMSARNVSYTCTKIGSDIQVKVLPYPVFTFCSFHHLIFCGLVKLLFRYIFGRLRNCWRLVWWRWCRWLLAQDFEQHNHECEKDKDFGNESQSRHAYLPFRRLAPEVFTRRGPRWRRGLWVLWLIEETHFRTTAANREASRHERRLVC